MEIRNNKNKIKLVIINDYLTINLSINMTSMTTYKQ